MMTTICVWRQSHLMINACISIFFKTILEHVEIKFILFVNDTEIIRWGSNDFQKYEFCLSFLHETISKIPKIKALAIGALMTVVIY